MAATTKIPALRFPGFKGEWDIEPIGNYIDVFTGVALKGEDISEDAKGWPILRGINITEGHIRHSPEIDRYYLGDIKPLEKFLVKKGDMVLGMDGSKVGKNVAIIDDANQDSILIQRVARVRANNKADIKFIYQKVSSSYFHQYVDVVNTSSGIPHISSQQIKDFTIGFPTLPEQQKIAAFLTAVDERLQQLQQQAALLQQYKKGVMQQIFSRHLRFKDPKGKDFPDWEEKRLGDVAAKCTKKNKKSDFINVFTNSAALGIVNQRDYFDKDIANQQNLFGYYIVEKDDFVYNPRISTSAPVGPISRNHMETGVMSPLYTVFQFKLGNLDFIENYFNSTFWHRHMEDISNYGARSDRMSFASEDFFNMPIPFPSLPEQTRIAAFLSALDAKIAAVQAQVAHTQGYKKGLLQQLFC